MSDIGLTMYGTASGGPEVGSVPVSVIVLTKNEAANIARCLESCAWAEQRLVLDSGSADKTVAMATQAGADVVTTTWRGFGLQREFALRLPGVRHDWVFFLDADEWVSVELADEIAAAVSSQTVAAYWQYVRLVFLGRWIRHCGWYPSGRRIHLMRRSAAKFEDDPFSEHPRVDGPLGRLANDLVDQDRKGLQAWLHKHVDYAGLEAQRRLTQGGTRTRLPHESVVRHFLKDRVAPRLPARPLATFVWMYVVRTGFLDGRPGLLFCFYHAWFQATVQQLALETEPPAPQATERPIGAGHD